MGISVARIGFGAQLKADEASKVVLQGMYEENPVSIFGLPGAKDSFERNTNETDPDGVMTIKNLTRTKKYFTQEGDMYITLAYAKQGDPDNYCEEKLRMTKEVMQSPRTLESVLIKGYEYLMNLYSSGERELPVNEGYKQIVNETLESL